MGKKTLALILATTAILTQTGQATGIKDLIQDTASNSGWFNLDNNAAASALQDQVYGNLQTAANGGDWSWSDDWSKDFDWGACGCNVTPPAPTPTPEPEPPTPIIPPSPSGNNSDCYYVYNATTCKMDYYCPPTPVIPDIPDVPSGNSSNCSCNNDTTPNNTTPNNTIPDVPSGNGTQNCTIVKVCRERNHSACWEEWYDYFDETCGCPKKQRKEKRKRICNFSDDATFDIAQFNTNSSYYPRCDCALFTNCTDIPPTPTPEPPSGNCSFTCEDVQLLQRLVANLTVIVGQQQDQIDLLVQTTSDLSSRLADAEEAIANITAAAESTGSSLAGVIEAVNGQQSSAVQAVLEYIRVNGLRFGDVWWFGSQYDVLFAIDTKDKTYYQFQQNKTAKL